MGRSKEGVIMWLAILVAILIAVPVQAGILGPSTYEECILENMKGVQSNVAAGHIVRACRQQFPEEPKVSRLEKTYPWLERFIRESKKVGYSDEEIEAYILSDPDLRKKE